VAHVDPVDAALGCPAGAADGINDGVEAVHDYAIDPSDTDRDKAGDELVRDGVRQEDSAPAPWPLCSRNRAASSRTGMQGDSSSTVAAGPEIS
jgi:hypothetical protein